MTQSFTGTTTICGWADWERPVDSHADALERMVSAHGGDAAGMRSLRADGAALAASASTVPVGLAAHRAIMLAVLGRLRLEDADGADLAASDEVAARIAALYERHGEELLAHLHGPFALALIDRGERRAVLAVDRVGIRTMCFSFRDGRLVFGTTADNVVGHPAVAPKVSDQAVFDYLYTHVVPSPRTIYAGVEKLLPGERLLVRGRSATRAPYWRVHYRESASAPVAALEEEFHRLLRSAVMRTADGDDVAAFLSGGTDSSTVTGFLTAVRGAPARTYSIGFTDAEFDESGYARTAARHFGADPRFHTLGPEAVVAAIPVIARHYDEPFGNESAAPTFHCARLARADGYRVMLAGDGGDELFGGNARYAKQKVFELYAAIPAALRRRVIEPIVLGGSAAALRKARSYIEQAKVPLPDRIETYNFLRREPLGEILDPGFLARIDPDEPLQLMRDQYGRAASQSAVSSMLHLDLKHVLADNDLRKVTRMCEAAGVEARYPLLDEAIVAFAAGLPPELKVRGFTLRYFFKRALRDFLPAEILRKKKHGFGLPFGLWVREHRALADAAYESLTAFARREYVRKTYIDRLIADHRSGHATYFGTMIWVLMTAEQWLAARRL